MSTQMKTQNKDIGDLLLKVQDEIKSLKTLIVQDGSKIDVKLIQSSLQKAENEIKEKADRFINQMNSQVNIMPSLEQQQLSSANIGSTFESLLDINAFSNNSNAIIKKDKPLSGNNRLEAKQQNHVITVQNLNTVSHKEQVIDEIHGLEHKNNKIDVFALSPGQQVKVVQETKALFNPENPRNRIALNENYNIQLPLIEKRNASKMNTNLITGTNANHLTTLPLAYRRNPTLIPPILINENETKHGLLSLIERGLIPHTAKITFEQVPFTTKPIQPNVMNAKFRNETSVIKREIVYKLDPKYINNNENTDIKENKEIEKSEFYTHKKNEIAEKKGSINNNKLSLIESPTKLNELNPSTNPLPPPVTPLTSLQLQFYDPSKFTHTFIIQNGRTRTDMQVYLSFKQSYCLRWGSIATIIKYLEDLCQTYSVPMACLDGLKVSELSRCIDMDLKPTLEELLDVFFNKEEVEKIVRTPGRKFKRKGGHNLAAIKIQCAWRRYRDRSSYLQYRKRKWAAGVIALTWLTYCKMTKAREKLRLSRMKHLENMRIRQKELIKAWPILKNSKRVIIHLPSLGFREEIRYKMKGLSIRENAQMTRLCDIFDENVDVIYVSSIALTEESLQYYSKLFGLRKAIETGNQSDISDCSHKYKIVIPEAINSFPTHNMALSTVLKYSPKALKRIKNLIKGRDAYLVPGVMNHDDLYVADYLNIPILGCEPEIANLYSTKSGSKRIFQSAKIEMPFGEFDIYNKEQLYESLAQLITENLSVQRWIFKLDDEQDGRGIAYCDTSKYLSCYAWALKEMNKFGDKWANRWAYEPTFVKILEELPSVLEKYTKPTNTQAYPTWEKYLKAFLSHGGIIEAHPPTDNITCLTVSLLIEPGNSEVKFISSGDHIHAESQYSCWGYTFPQTSVDPRELNDVCLRIAESCRERNIMGYVDVDFVTFIDIKTDKQILWATDLNISYSNNVAMSSLLFYLTNGMFNHNLHSYEIILNEENLKQKKNKKLNKQEKRSRFAVMSNKLNHSNLAVIHYSVFFQACRALGIGFDVNEKQGTIFTLIDSLNHVNIGMLTVMDNLQVCMQNFARNLNALHKEISSDNMQGKNNFLLAAQDIKNVLTFTDEKTEESVTTSDGRN